MTLPSSKSAKPIIALDIDDVVANVIDSVRLWANEVTGLSLGSEAYHTDDDYWHYFDSIWERHGVSDRINFTAVLEGMANDQSNVAVVEGARETIQALKQRYELVFITSRPSYQQKETRRWLNERIDPTIPMYMAYNPMVDHEARSKGEICAELGVSVLIDDNISNCESALEYGVDAVLFGAYGWNDKAPGHIKRCGSWNEVAEYLLHEAQ